MNDTKQLYSRILALGLIILLICPSLIQDGMFMDGQQYACVSKNLAEGYGTWWFPYLSESWWKAGSNHFMEHPPLVYWIQAGFFKVLGDSMYTERIYCLLTALLTAFLIHRIWKFVFKDHPEIARMSALPVICWIIIPVNFWGYQHNIQENTMGIFSLLAVLLFLKSTVTHQWKYLLLILSGLCVSLAFLSKGPPGLFPLVAVAAYWVAYRNFSVLKALLYSVVVMFSVCVFFSIMLNIDAARESLSFYVNDRLLYRIGNEPTVGNRFSILIRLLMELLPSIGLVALSMIISLSLKLKPERFLLFRKEFVFFLLIGLSGALPLMLTPVQRGFYLNPAFPFFGIALAIMAAPYVNLIARRLADKKRLMVGAKSIAVAVLFAGLILTAMNYGKSRRDGEMLSDIHAIGNSLPERAVIGTNHELFDQWNLQFYFMRYYGITLRLDVSEEYLLLPRSSLSGVIIGKHPRSLNTKLYVLWEPNDPDKGMQF